MSDKVDDESPLLKAGTATSVSRRKFELTSAELSWLLTCKTWFETKQPNSHPVDDLRRNTAILLRKLHEVEPRKQYVDSIFCLIHMTSDDDFFIDRLAGRLESPCLVPYIDATDRLAIAQWLQRMLDADSAALSPPLPFRLSLPVRSECVHAGQSKLAVCDDSGFCKRDVTADHSCDKSIAIQHEYTPTGDRWPVCIHLQSLQVVRLARPAGHCLLVYAVCLDTFDFDTIAKQLHRLNQLPSSDHVVSIVDYKIVQQPLNVSAITLQYPATACVCVVN
jgi:hypothetical protein